MTAITNIQGFRTQDCFSNYATPHSFESKMLDDKVSRLGNELLMLKTIHGGFISADKKAQLLEQGVSKEDLNSIEKNRARLLGGMPPKKHHGFEEKEPNHWYCDHTVYESQAVKAAESIKKEDREDTQHVHMKCYGGVDADRKKEKK